MPYVWRNCPTCNRYKRTDQHHIYPQVYFNGKGPTIQLCQSCHQGGVEHLIPNERLTKEEYENIFIVFVLIQSKIYNINVSKTLKEAFGRSYEAKAIC